MEVARRFVADRYTQKGCLTLRHWRGGWWEWRGSKWAEVDNRGTRAYLYRFAEHATYLDDKGESKPWAPNRHKVADVLEAVQAITRLADDVEQPSWIGGRPALGVGAIVACQNGLLVVGSRTLIPHDPRWFSQTCVPFAFAPDAPLPQRWMRFLGELWPEDPHDPEGSDEARELNIAALAEWFGYVASGKTDQHKIGLMTGPTRGGKGLISRIQGALIGPENVAAPTLSSLGSDFGLAPLLGKPLAVVSDARFDARGSQVVVERLLSISGQDPLTVNRKYRDHWTGKLPTRFFIVSNELPRLGDASMAVAGRFLALTLTRSWLGKEDRGLECELLAELPGILNWSLDGLERLNRQGRFTVPAGSQDAISIIQDLASPVAAFVRDCCVLGTRGEIPAAHLYAAWKQWAEDNGHKPGSAPAFGKDLRAVVPGLRSMRPRAADSATERRELIYSGVTIRGVEEIDGEYRSSEGGESEPRLSGTTPNGSQASWAGLGRDPSHCDPHPANDPETGSEPLVAEALERFS
jgi:putative DNA primase/helicase